MTKCKGNQNMKERKVYLYTYVEATKLLMEKKCYKAVKGRTEKP